MSETFYCHKHHLTYEAMMLERGKTDDICPECDKERKAAMEEFFKDIPRVTLKNVLSLTKEKED